MVFAVSASSPSCTAGSDAGIVASDESSISSGNLLESMFFESVGGGNGKLDGAVEGRVLFVDELMNGGGSELVLRRGFISKNLPSHPGLITQ